MKQTLASRRRASGLALTAVLALMLGLLSSAPASADPTGSGWREGWCKQGEGLTVVVDFGDGSERGWEARCKIGGTLASDGQATRKSALEAVGYEVTITNQMVSHIDGIGDELSPWWRFTTSQMAAGWLSEPFEVPAAATNWFQGACLSEAGCAPRVPPQFEPGSVDPGPTDPGPTDPTPTDPTTKATSKPKTNWVRKPTTKKAGTVRVTVPRVAGRPKASGKVVVVLKNGKKTKRVQAKLPAGRVKVKVQLPKVAKGNWKLVVRYKGDRSYRATKSTKTIKVKK